MIVAQVQKSLKDIFLDMEAVFIKRKTITTVLLLFFFALSISTSTAFATTSSNTSSNIAAGSALSSDVSFTSAQINAASTKVKTFEESNNRLPNYVTINSYQVTMPQFLQLMTQNILNINSGSTSSVSLTTVSSPSSATETITSGNIYKSEYITIANSIDTSIDSTSKAPSYVSSSLGNIKFETLVYTFTKILTYQATNSKLPNYVSVKSSTIQNNSSTPEGALRPVYIFSDNINNKAIDNNRINILVNALQNLGLKAYNYGVGVNTYTLLRNTNMPSNALIVQINGGACAGTFVDMGSAYYKNLLGSRKLCMVFTDIAKKITGLAWLERAHDDNFSPASFTGLAHPDQYLLKNGYKYYEGYTNSKVNELAAFIYQVASS